VDVVMAEMVKVEMEVVAKPEEVKPVIQEKMVSTDELRNIAKKFQEDRVMKEVAAVEVKVPFGGAVWEKEVRVVFFVRFESLS
jgi:hypothetical protein